MPYVTRWVPPEEFVRATGPEGEVAVYHCYKGDRPLNFWFTTMGNDEPGMAERFDIRDHWDPVPIDPLDFEAVDEFKRQVLVSMIETGKLTQKGVR